MLFHTGRFKSDDSIDSERAFNTFTHFKYLDGICKLIWFRSLHVRNHIPNIEEKSSSVQQHAHQLLCEFMQLRKKTMESFPKPKKYRNAQLRIANSIKNTRKKVSMENLQTNLFYSYCRFCTHSSQSDTSIHWYKHHVFTDTTNKNLFYSQFTSLKKREKL